MSEKQEYRLDDDGFIIKGKSGEYAETEEMIKRCNAYPRLIEVLKEYDDKCKDVVYTPNKNKQFHGMPVQFTDKIVALLTELNETGD